MNKRTTVCMAGVWVALSLAGCATEQTSSRCPVPDGATCMPTADVYAATNDNDHVAKPAKAAAPGPTVVAPTTTYDGATAPGVVSTTPAALPAPTVQAAVPQAAMVQAVFEPVSVRPHVEPYREPAQILNVYVAPWQDESGDLHLGQRVVTEVVGRRWRLGNSIPVVRDDDLHVLSVPNDAANDSQVTARAGAVGSSHGTSSSATSNH